MAQRTTTTHATGNGFRYLFASRGIIADGLASPWAPNAVEFKRTVASNRAASGRRARACAESPR